MPHERDGRRGQLDAAQQMLARHIEQADAAVVSCDAQHVALVVKCGCVDARRNSAGQARRSPCISARRVAEHPHAAVGAARRQHNLMRLAVAACERVPAAWRANTAWLRAVWYTSERGEKARHVHALPTCSREFTARFGPALLNVAAQR